MCFIREKAQEDRRQLRRVEEEEVVRVAKLREAQQGERRSSIEKLRKKAEEQCGKEVLEEAQLLELGWYTLEIIVTYNECRGCGRKGSYTKDNKGQGVLQDRKFWCGYQEKEEKKAAWPKEAKAQ